MALKIKRKVELPASEKPAVTSTDNLAPGEEPVFEGEAEIPGEPTTEAAKPDEFAIAAEGFFEKLAARRQQVVVGIGALVIVMIGYSMVQNNSAAANASNAKLALDALSLQTAEVGDGSGAEFKNKDKTEARRGRIFKTNEARWKAALEAAQAAAAAGSSAALPLVAAAQVASGSGDAAIATYQAAMDKAPAGDDVAFALSLASAQASAKKFPEAIATLDKLAAETPNFALSAKYLKAELTDTYGEPKAALAAWKELTTAFPESPIKDVVDGRIVQLEIDLGIEANEGSGAKEGSGA